MADTARTVFADGLFADDLFAAGLWATDEPVEVPDVVGETQAAGTTTLETALFVVSVQTAYSSVVAIGLIISQSPAGGAFAAEGSTVTITVSLGDAPIADDTPGAGGIYYELQKITQERQRRKKRIEEAKEAEAKLDAIDREIAELIHEDESKAEERKHLERIKKLVSETKEKVNIEKVDKALEAAKAKQTLASYEALQRVFEQSQEEEELFLLQLLANID